MIVLSTIGKVRFVFAESFPCRSLIEGGRGTRGSSGCDREEV